MYQKIATSLLCTAALAAGSVLLTGCHHNKVVNPIANVDSKQPDKVLYDRAMAAIKSGKYDVSRSLLQTMINTYPDSEFVARAKLSIADSWYAEANTAAYSQAEREYKDFITFFPNMPEAAEAQMKIANIHYNEMGKPDRDYTQARRAEDEYRQMIQQFPDSKLVPQAKQRLREVQEVLADGQFRVANFYYLRESWPAAIARFKTLADSYPLYSGADQSLWYLGQAYENEIRIMQDSRMKAIKAKPRQQLISEFRKDAIDAYSRLVTRYPLSTLADDAAGRLQTLEAPVPKPTPEMIAQNKEEIASRSQANIRQRMMENFVHRPDTHMAAKVGEPTMEDPQQASAPAIAQHASKVLTGQDTGEGKLSAEVVTGKDTATASADGNSSAASTAATQPAATTPAAPAAPAAFESVPENPNATTSNSTTTVSGASPSTNHSTGSNAPAPAASSDPQTTQPAAAPTSDPAPDQNATAPNSSATPASPKSDDQAAATTDTASKDDSSSAKTKKKKHKLLF
jgi:outer membrane protein assembly factor BamD